MDTDFVKELTGDAKAQWALLDEDYKRNLTKAALRLASRKARKAVSNITGVKDDGKPDYVTDAFVAELESFGVTEAATFLDTIANTLLNLATKIVIK